MTTKYNRFARRTALKTALGGVFKTSAETRREFLSS